MKIIFAVLFGLVMLFTYALGLLVVDGATWRAARPARVVAIVVYLGLVGIALVKATMAVITNL